MTETDVGATDMSASDMGVTEAPMRRDGTARFPPPTTR